MEKTNNWEEIKESINNGGLAIIPTDTLYGISASVKFEDTVEKIYKIKKRSKNKPLIILVSSLDDLRLFGIKLTQNQKEKLSAVWPGSVSVILDCPSSELNFLHRGTDSLAFRFPDDKDLLNLIRNTGPIVSTSVNLEGQNPVSNFSSADSIFGKDIDLFLEKENISAKHSTLLDMRGDGVRLIREGKGFTKIKELLSL